MKPQTLLLPLGSQPRSLGQKQGPLGEGRAAPGIRCMAAVPRAALWCGGSV